MSTLSQFLGGDPSDGAGGVAGLWAVKGAGKYTNDSPFIDAPYTYGGASWALTVTGTATPAGSLPAACFRVDSGNTLYIRNCLEAYYSGSGLFVCLSGLAAKFNLKNCEYINKFRWVMHQPDNISTDATVANVDRRLITIDDLAFIAMANNAGLLIDNYSQLANINKFHIFSNNNDNLLFSIENAALTVASVETILIAADADTQSGSGTRTIRLNGGTSAGASSLSAAGAAARASLISKGFTITLNA